MKLFTISMKLMCILSTAEIGKSQINPPCDSQIYCQGDLLKTVQNAGLFNDSKTFVDMQLKANPANVLSAFRKLGKNLTHEQIKTFVGDNFDGPGTEFENWTPTDWKSNIKLFNKIKDAKYLEWARNLHDLWKVLGRKIHTKVRDQPQRFSLIYSEKPFIVPGGRFREFYYWDSYWVLMGLHVSEMEETIKGMLENFLEIVEKFGFVPNGARVYYTRRSQPPFLIPMVNDYYQIVKDTAFLRTHINSLEKEYEFWMHNQTVTVQRNGQNYTLNQYSVDMQMPRPESYREDVNTSLHIPEDQRPQLFANIASAAESGWDFSTRWFAHEGQDINQLHTIKTTDIVPVDLNSILCMNEKLLARFYGILGNSVKRDMYNTYANKRVKAIKAVFWNDQERFWHDWDLKKQTHRNKFYAAGITPIYFGCHGETEAEKLNKEKLAYEYLQKNKILDYIAGIPTSLVNSGQQWDLPNAWPPLQEMMIHAMGSSQDTNAKEFAKQIAQKWILTNYKAYKESGYMFEKYNVNVQGAAGRGGEYNVQVGFGWTNGVALKLLEQYGDILHTDTSSSRTQHISTYLFSFVILTITTSYLFD